MRNLSVILVFTFAFLILVSFFLPWVSINSPVSGAISKVFSGKKDALIMKISGFQVPILANRSDSRLMVEMIQLFNPGVKDADKKSWLIWGVPLFALMLSCGYVFLQENKWFNLAVGIIGILIFVVGVYKLKTTDLDKMIMSVNIMPGLWFLLSGYLGIGLVGLFKFIKPNRFKNHDLLRD
jgi:hypothetical protein